MDLKDDIRICECTLDAKKTELFRMKMKLREKQLRRESELRLLDRTKRFGGDDEAESRLRSTTNSVDLQREEMYNLEAEIASRKSMLEQQRKALKTKSSPRCHFLCFHSEDNRWDMLNFFIGLKSDSLTRYLEMTEGVGIVSIKMRTQLDDLLKTPGADEECEARAEHCLQMADPKNVFPMHNGCVYEIRRYLREARSNWCCLNSGPFKFSRFLFDPSLNMRKLYRSFKVNFCATKDGSHKMRFAPHLTRQELKGAPLFGNDHKHCCGGQCPPLPPMRGLTLIIHEAAIVQKSEKCCHCGPAPPAPRIRVKAELEQGGVRCAMGETSAHSIKEGENVIWSEFVNVDGASRRKELQKLRSLTEAKEKLEELQQQQQPRPAAAEKEIVEAKQKIEEARWKPVLDWNDKSIRLTLTVLKEEFWGGVEQVGMVKICLKPLQNGGFTKLDITRCVPLYLQDTSEEQQDCRSCGSSTGLLEWKGKERKGMLEWQLIVEPPQVYIRDNKAYFGRSMWNVAKDKLNQVGELGLKDLDSAIHEILTLMEGKGCKFRDGKISKEELSKEMQKRKQFGSKNDVDHILEQLTLERSIHIMEDDNISKEDLEKFTIEKGWYHKRRKSVANLNLFDQIFDKFDASKDKKINAEELRRLMKVVCPGEKLSLEQIDQMVMEADRNGDGEV